MKCKFCGDITLLKKIVKMCRVTGTWRFISENRLYQFKAQTGENLNWWPRTGTINFQGGDEPILAQRFAKQLDTSKNPANGLLGHP